MSLRPYWVDNTLIVNEPSWFSTTRHVSPMSAVRSNACAVEVVPGTAVAPVWATRAADDWLTASCWGAVVVEPPDVDVLLLPLPSPPPPHAVKATMMVLRARMFETERERVFALYAEAVFIYWAYGECGLRARQSSNPLERVAQSRPLFRRGNGFVFVTCTANSSR